MWELVQDNWKPITAVVSGLLLFGFPKIKAFVSNFSFGKTSGTEDGVVDISVEKKDQECITHLRNRASKMKHNELLKDIKAIDAKFFDIHSGIYDDATVNVTNS